MINIYCHQNKKNTEWTSWHELVRPWPSDPDAIGWPTSNFISNIQCLPGSENYFNFKPWHSDIGEDQKGFYLSHHGNSKSMNECFGLSTLQPGVRDQINQGVLTLLVVYVMESFDSKLTLLEWQDKFCCHLNEVGIRRPNSVKVLLGSWHHQMHLHQDPRVQWIYYPFVETCMKVKALRHMGPPVPRAIIERPYKFLHLVRTPRIHRQIVAMFLEYLGIAERGLLTWPMSWPSSLFIDRLGPHNVYEVGMRSFPHFRQFVAVNRQLSCHYRDSADGGQIRGGVPDDWFSPAPYYDHCEFDLINETHHCIGDVVFLTEKTFRPLYFGVPFVLIGSGPGLQVLHSLGYKTFDSIWSESYDQEKSPMHALAQACELVRDLCQSNLTAQGQQLTEIVDHNQTVFWSRDHARLIHDALTSHDDISYAV